MESARERSQNSLTAISCFSFVSAILFYIFFMASKHIPFLSVVAPFLEDPYDAVGSFAFQIALLAGILNLVRLYLMKKYAVQGRELFVIRGNFVVAWSILITMVVDGIAVIKAGLRQPSQAETVLYSAMLALSLLSAVILMRSWKAKGLLEGALTREDFVANELDPLFKSGFLARFNPSFHPIKSVVLFSLLMGVLVSLVQIIGEGPAPTLGKTLLVFSVITIIEATGIFILSLLIGRYLGILGRIRSVPRST